MVVDANDIDVVILGSSLMLRSIADDILIEYIKDNPRDRMMNVRPLC